MKITLLIKFIIYLVVICSSFCGSLNRDISYFKNDSNSNNYIENETIEIDNSFYDDINPHDGIKGSETFSNFKNVDYFPTTNFSMNDYFYNLIDYSPHNNNGSCGYVSLIQLMSFYDSFYNDNIIPDIYDGNYTLASNENYTTIKHVYSLDFSNMKHNHLNNYVLNNKNYCGCNINFYMEE